MDYKEELNSTWDIKYPQIDNIGKVSRVWGIKKLGEENTLSSRYYGVDIFSSFKNYFLVRHDIIILFFPKELIHFSNITFKVMSLSH